MKGNLTVSRQSTNIRNDASLKYFWKAARNKDKRMGKRTALTPNIHIDYFKVSETTLRAIINSFFSQQKYYNYKSKKIARISDNDSMGRDKKTQHLALCGNSTTNEVPKHGIWHHDGISRSHGTATTYDNTEGDISTALKIHRSTRPRHP